VKAALGGMTPKAKAKELVSGTKLDEPKFRKALIDGGRKAVEQSNDPLIVWARGLDASYRELRKVERGRDRERRSPGGPQDRPSALRAIRQIRVPDATFTLRLSYGRVAGYSQGTTRSRTRPRSTASTTAASPSTAWSLQPA